MTTYEMCWLSIWCGAGLLTVPLIVEYIIKRIKRYTPDRRKRRW